MIEQSTWQTILTAKWMVALPRTTSLARAQQINGVPGSANDHDAEVEGRAKQTAKEIATSSRSDSNKRDGSRERTILSK